MTTKTAQCTIIFVCGITVGIEFASIFPIHGFEGSWIMAMGAFITSIITTAVIITRRPRHARKRND